MRRLEWGIALLSRGEAVFTDRLHGHILSVICGIPDVAFDNATGKVSAYHRQWLTGVEGSAVASSADEAMEKMASIRQSDFVTTQEGKALLRTLGR
jgi:pyruvyl transferase EpsO